MGAIALAHGLIRRYALAVLASMSLATLLWLLLAWLDGGGYLHPDVQVTGALFVVERISEANGECYRYEGDRCNGSVCIRDGRHIVLAACAPGESPPCIDPTCTAFVGEARRW